MDARGRIETLEAREEYAWKTVYGETVDGTPEQIDALRDEIRHPAAAAARRVARSNPANAVRPSEPIRQALP